VDLGAHRLAVQERHVRAGPGRLAGLLCQRGDLVRPRGHLDLAGALELAVDAVAVHGGLELVQVLGAEALQGVELVGPAPLPVGEAVGEAGLAEPAVAPGRRPADLV